MNIFVSTVQFPIYTKRLHPNVLAIPFAPHLGIPFHCQSWICTDENETLISIFVTSWYLPPPLILCENAEVIFCLWWSAFWTPAVAVCLKRGPDPENSYSRAYIGCVSCPTSETVIQKCNFSPDLPWQGLERWGPGLTCCRGLTT